jgi:hypothetical protein
MRQRRSQHLRAPCLGWPAAGAQVDARLLDELRDQ